MIEKGRHQGIEKNLRFCPFCPRQVEDENHFLIDCTCFTGLRNDLFDKVNRKVISFPYINKIHKFNILMTTSDITTLTAQYVNMAFTLREFLLENHKRFI